MRIQLTLILALWFAAAARAQDTNSTPQMIPRDQFARSDSYNTEDVKIKLIDGRKFKGRLIYVDRNKIVVKHFRKNEQTTILVQDISAIYVRSRGSIGLGILAGLAAGGLIGYVAGSAQDNNSSQSLGSLPSMSGAAVAVYAGVSGAVIGGLICSKRTKYSIEGKKNSLNDFALRMGILTRN